jgi:hypothetical protein
MPELPEGSICKFGEREFHFSLAATALELMKGLRGVTSLEPYDGMLFDFGCNFSPIMTPSGLRFPIDVAFITSQGKVVEIHRLDPEDGFTRSTTRRDIQFALEVPVGFFDTNDIKIGDTLEF